MSILTAKIRNNFEFPYALVIFLNEVSIYMVEGHPILFVYRQRFQTKTPFSSNKEKWRLNEFCNPVAKCFP